MGKAARQTVLHPVVCSRGDHQQDVPHNGTEQAPSHKAVHGVTMRPVKFVWTVQKEKKIEEYFSFLFYRFWKSLNAKSV